jgi:hypothetical protein
VVAPAVGFDDHLLLAPEEVDEVALDQDVDGRRWQIDLPREGEKIDLRHGFRLQRLRIDLERDPPQLPHSLAAAPAGDDAPEPRPGELVALVGLHEHALQPFRFDSSRQIKQHPLPHGHRNPTLHRHFIWLQPPSLMQPDPPVSPRMETPRLPQHLDRAIRATDPPELPGAEVREHRPRSTREHRGHRMPLTRQLPMPYREYAVVERNQQAPKPAMEKKALLDSQFQQLPVRDDAMLPLGKRTNSDRCLPVFHRLPHTTRTASNSSSGGKRI